MKKAAIHGGRGGDCRRKSATGKPDTYCINSNVGDTFDVLTIIFYK